MNDPVEDELELTERAQPAAHHGLSSTSFVCLVLVQFLTALNDHTFRWLAIPIAKPLMPNDASALSIGLAGFTVPFLLLATPAGYLADRFSKARVVTACKLAEIVVFSVGLLAIVAGSPALLFTVVAATGVLAALFAPAKLGSVPELVRDSELSTANGWMGLMNVLPAALGFLLGNWLASVAQPAPGDPITWLRVAPAAAFMLLVSIAGAVASLYIARLPAAEPTRRWQWNLIAETRDSVRQLFGTTVLLRTALGITFFWMLASLAQINIDTFGIHDLGLDQRDIGVLGMVLVIGVGLGSVLAGWLSAGHIELGLVPLGALGISTSSLVLYVVGGWGETHPDAAFYGSCVAFLGLGVSAGLFDVPLEAYLQHRSPPERLGTILAGTNFLVFSGILGIAGLFYVLQQYLEFSAGAIFLLAGLGTIVVGVYIATLMPTTVIRALFWIFSKLAYRLRVYGREHFPREGGVLLVPNHVTWVDGILLLVSAPRPVRFIAYADFVKHPHLAWLAKIFEVIPIKSDGGPKALMQSLRTAREAIQAGQCVCIFAEGTLTRSGQMQPFHGGFLKIVQGTGAPVVPVYLHGLWGSIFSYRGGKFFWKWPCKWPYPVSINFGKPIVDPQRVDEVRSAVQEMGAAVVERERHREKDATRQFLRACRRRWSHPKVADSLGTELTGGRLLIATLALRRALLRKLSPDEAHVGVFLPPAVGGALAYLAVALTGRVTVGLNYTLSDADLEHIVLDAGVKHVITSRTMQEKRPLHVSAELLFLEDLKESLTGWDKAWAAFAARCVPAFLLDRLLGLHRLRPDDPMTIIYTSGSTGEPKGVVLTHHNITGTVDAANQVFQVDATDSLLGVLPLFHSFGYIASFWLPLTLDAKVTFHPNPLDARRIGELAEQHKATILFATPTFLRSYLKRCTKEQFSTLDLVVVGAEKLPGDLAEQFHEKYGIWPQEGYGTTETSGPAAVNIPDHRCEMVTQKGTKLGTVGRPLPGVAARIVDVDTGAILGVNAEGLVHIKGPNIMLGYYHKPEKTAEVLRDGWYNTGDMGLVDEEGFLHITGRMSRFSKIGGEMVPHLKVEEELLRILESATGEDAGPLLVVTAVPDPKKGERLVVLHRPLQRPIPEILDQLSQTGLPNLFLPSADSFYAVDHVPLLGTGKLDLRAIKALALEIAAKPVSAT